MKLNRRNRRGQAILEYILMTLMLAVTMAVTIRGVNRTIYSFWTGLALEVSIPCPDCTMPAAKVPINP